MKVIITGAYGLLGTAFQDIVKHRQKHGGEMNIDFVYLGRADCDLRDRVDVMGLFQRIRPDVVIHLASHVGGVYDNLQHNYTYLMDNTKMHTNIVDACHEFKVSRLVNILSTCIFPDRNVVYPLTSDQLHNGLPNDSNVGYAYSKRFLHVASSILSDQGTTSVVNVIPTNLYGENDNYDIERAHVIPALIHKAYLAKLDRTKFKIRGSGNAVRQFLYAKDLANILFLCMTKNFGSPNTTFIASPPKDAEMTISEVVEIIRKYFDIPEEDVEYESWDTDGQFRKTTTDHEWRLEFPDVELTKFEEGMANVLSFFTENYPWCGKLKSRKLSDHHHQGI